MSTVQVLQCQGELWITVQQVYGDRNGAIRFKDSSQNDFGSLRVIGQTINNIMFGALTIDTVGMSDGLRIRTGKSQGSTSIYPQSNGDSYAFTVSGQSCNGYQMNLFQPRNLSGNQDYNNGNTPVLDLTRYNTKSGTVTIKPILKITQNEITKQNEMVLLDIGTDSYNTYYASFGMKTSLNDLTNSTSNYGIIGIKKNDYSDTIKECLGFDYNQNVTIPVKLTAGTIRATTYENLPPTPSSDLLPLTLDKTNNFVGINNIAPIEALDVVGNGTISGTLHANNIDVTHNLHVGDATVSGTISATTYLNLPPVPESEFLPMTLDKTENRVGINQTTPVEALDVTGNIQASGSIMAPLLEGDDAIVTNITAGTINAGTYLNLPPVPASELLPISLDKTNNFVGINQTVPTEALDVTGNIKASGSVTGATLAGTLSTASQPNITSLGTLTSLTVTGDTNIDSNTLKVDSTNNRIGILTGTPSYNLDVNGTAKIKQTTLIGDTSTVGTTRLGIGVNSARAALDVNGTVLLGSSTAMRNVGINVDAAQTENFHVNGTARVTQDTSIGGSLAVSGDVTTNTIKVDSINQRLGVLIATPEYTLDVNGNANIRGNLTATLSTAAQPNITSLGTLSSLNVTGDTNIDSNTLKVDSVNNRVGILTGTPAYNLDVNGTTNITGNTTIGGNLTVTGKVNASGGLGIGSLNKVFIATAQTFSQGTSTIAQVDNILPGTYIFSGYLQATSSVSLSSFYCGFSRNPLALTYVPDDGNNIGTREFQHYSMGASIALYKTTIMTIATTSTIAFNINNNNTDTITTIAGKCGITYIKLSS